MLRICTGDLSKLHKNEKYFPDLKWYRFGTYLKLGSNDHCNVSWNQLKWRENLKIQNTILNVTGYRTFTLSLLWFHLQKTRLLAWLTDLYWSGLTPDNYAIAGMSLCNQWSVTNLCSMHNVVLCKHLIFLVLVFPKSGKKYSTNPLTHVYW